MNKTKKSVNKKHRKKRKKSKRIVKQTATPECVLVSGEILEVEIYPLHRNILELEHERFLVLHLDLPRDEPDFVIVPREVGTVCKVLFEHSLRKKVKSPKKLPTRRTKW